MTDKKLELEHQIRDTLSGFFHRVAPVGFSKKELCRESEWVDYMHAAVYQKGKFRVMCVTAYNKDKNECPIPDKLYQMVEY